MHKKPNVFVTSRVRYCVRNKNHGEPNMAQWTLRPAGEFASEVERLQQSIRCEMSMSIDDGSRKDHVPEISTPNGEEPEPTLAEIVRAINGQQEVLLNLSRNCCVVCQISVIRTKLTLYHQLQLRLCELVHWCFVRLV